MDLLNQPDMLAALLGPTQADDDWGSPAAYQTHTRHTSRHEDFDLPPMMGDNVDGDMVIPEPVPYTEPEHEPYYEDEPVLHDTNYENVRIWTDLGCLFHSFCRSYGMFMLKAYAPVPEQIFTYLRCLIPET